MKLECLWRVPSKRLLLIFAGWGMDARPFASLRRDDCDLMVAYDYSDGVERGDDALSEYDEIMVLAWSFGVIAADRFMALNPDLPFTSRVAVNGTLWPVDEQYGIAPTVFRGTLDNLSDATVVKFRRRMCGGSKAYADWEEKAPRRSLDSLRRELEAIPLLGTGSQRWDVAYVADSDAIIPPANQRDSWLERGVELRSLTGSHLPDFEEIVKEIVVNKQLVARRFRGASASYEDNAPVQRAVAESLSEKWRVAMNGATDLKKVVEIGAGTGMFTRCYSRWLHPETLELRDLSAISENLPGVHRICDGESSLRDDGCGAFDAIASASTIQWFSSVPSFIEQAARTLRPDGWLVLSTFGPDNFKELSPNGYISTARWRKILAENFTVHALEEWTEVLEFASALALLEHLKLTGVNAVNSGAATVSAARSILSSGLRRLTYHPVLIIARKRSVEKD